MTREHLMRSQLLWCLMANILATLLSVGVLYLYPAGRGFTFTSGTTTHFVQGGPLEFRGRSWHFRETPSTKPR
jgi:hypothetical protein